MEDKPFNIQFSYMNNHIGGVIMAKDIHDVISKLQSSFNPKVPHPGIVIRSVTEMKIKEVDNV